MMQAIAPAPVLISARSRFVEYMERECQARFWHDAIRHFARDTCNEAQDCHVWVDAWIVLFAGNFRLLAQSLQDSVDHIVNLRSFPDFNEATPRLKMGGVILYMQQGSDEIVNTEDNFVTRTTVYTDSFSGKTYTVRGSAWEDGSRAYNRCYVNGKQISENNYSLHLSSSGAWVNSSMTALRMGMNTGEIEVLAQTGAIPF
jgi:hypothetical protein